jgi:hypothetical protein
MFVVQQKFAAIECVGAWRRPPTEHVAILGRFTPSGDVGPGGFAREEKRCLLDVCTGNFLRLHDALHPDDFL